MWELVWMFSLPDNELSFYNLFMDQSEQRIVIFFYSYLIHSTVVTIKRYTSGSFCPNLISFITYIRNLWCYRTSTCNFYYRWSLTLMSLRSHHRVRTFSVILPISVSMTGDNRKDIYFISSEISDKYLPALIYSSDISLANRKRLIKTQHQNLVSHL